MVNDKAALHASVGQPFCAYCAEKCVPLRSMGKGRDKELIAARDQRIFERYYYWTEVKRLRFDDAVKKLSEEEFYLSESRILQVVRKCISSGATVEGKTIARPLFTGFRVSTTQRRKAGSRPSATVCVRQQGRQLELFEE